MHIEDTCQWVQESWDDDLWSTGCGNAFSFNEGKPSDNSCKFCMYCGRSLIEIPYKDEEE